jgi:hypothetical protein
MLTNGLEVDGLPQRRGQQIRIAGGRLNRKKDEQNERRKENRENKKTFHAPFPNLLVGLEAVFVQFGITVRVIAGGEPEYDGVVRREEVFDLRACESLRDLIPS